MAIIEQTICDSCGKPETQARRMLTLHLYTLDGASSTEGSGEPFKYDVHAGRGCIAKLLRKIPRSFKTLDALGRVDDEGPLDDEGA
jgi:hypothetical protein